MYILKEGISGFGRTDGETEMDGQPENIMPPAPKSQGIKIPNSSWDMKTYLWHQLVQHHLHVNSGRDNLCFIIFSKTLQINTFNIPT